MSWKRVIHLAGVLLVAASFLFIAMLFWRQRHVFAQFRPDARGLLVLAWGAALYAGAGLALASAWRKILLWAGEGEVSWAVARWIYARTQIGKYLPGNVAQIAGRHAMGRSQGWSHAGLAVSSVVELLSQVMTASLFALVGLLFAGFEINTVDLPFLLLLIVGVGLVTVAGTFAVDRLVRRFWPALGGRFGPVRLLKLWPVVLRHIVFFAVGGALLAAFTLLVMGPMPTGFLFSLVSLFTIAWIAGTVTPGAPSGFGIRETALVLGMGALVPPAQALLIAGLLRIATVGGDCLFFLLAGTRRPAEAH